MQVVINVPDNLSQTRVDQAIQEFEQQLRKEAESLSSQPQEQRKIYAHLCKVDSLSLPSRDELHER